MIEIDGEFFHELFYEYTGREILKGIIYQIITTMRKQAIIEYQSYQYKMVDFYKKDIGIPFLGNYLGVD